MAEPRAGPIAAAMTDAGPLREPMREVTHRRVLDIAIPIVLSNATVPILGAVDTGVVGQIGLAAPIGAVGIGAIILTGVYWIFGFLRMGTTGLAAQAGGEGNRAEVAAILTRVLMIGFGAGALMILAQSLIFRAGFALSPASDEVESLARSYMAIRIWSAPAAIAIYGITGWLIAQERTRGVLVLQVWMNLLNIVLDLWFVLSLGWGVQASPSRPSSPNGRACSWAFGCAVRRFACPPGATGRGSSTG